MKKPDIRKKVEQAKERHLKDAIDSEGRYRAHEEVREALFPERKLVDRGPYPAEAETNAKPSPAMAIPRSKIFSPSDPKICGGA
jgi:hypothetical protein